MIKLRIRLLNLLQIFARTFCYSIIDSQIFSCNKSETYQPKVGTYGNSTIVLLLEVLTQIKLRTRQIVYRTDPQSEVNTGFIIWLFCQFQNLFHFGML